MPFFSVTERPLLLIWTPDTPAQSALNMRDGAKEYFSIIRSSFGGENHEARSLLNSTALAELADSTVRKHN
jgi:hypothetical protein